MLTFFKKNGVFAGLVLLFGLLFVYHLGYGSLASFDEAWYGSIARNVLQNKELLVLSYNGEVFNDHPPFIIWMMACSYALFGISEFSTRILSAVSGALVIGLIYAIGQQLFSKRVGIIAAAMIGSSLWFWLRARSGNLDIPFVYLYLQSIFLLLSVIKFPKHLPILGISVGLLLLSKTLVGWSILPILFFEFLIQRKKLQFSWKQIVLSCMICGAIVLPWYIKNQLIDHNFLKHHFFEIGMREKSGFEFDHIKTTSLYFQSGVGKWFKLIILGSFAGLGLAFWKLKYRHSFGFVLVWAIIIGAPFVTSSRTEVWHLLPLYPPLMLLSAGALVGILDIFLNAFKFKKIVQIFCSMLLVTGTLSIAAYQINQFWKLVVPDKNVTSDEADISKKAAGISKEIYLKEVFLPAAVFYGQAKVWPIGFRPNAYQSMVVDLSEKNSVYVVTNLDLAQLQQDKIEVELLDQNGSYSIIQGTK